MSLSDNIAFLNSGVTSQPIANLIRPNLLLSAASQYLISEEHDHDN